MYFYTSHTHFERQGTLCSEKNMHDIWHFSDCNEFKWLQKFVLDINLALNRYCLWSWDYSTHALHYAIVFWKKILLWACFIIHKYAVFISILGFQWLMQAHRYKYLQDYRRLFSNCKPNEEWLHIVLPCYNEKEKGLFYVKCLKLVLVSRSFL